MLLERMLTYSLRVQHAFKQAIRPHAFKHAFKQAIRTHADI
jgi:hypothetical protein